MEFEPEITEINAAKNNMQRVESPRVFFVGSGEDNSQAAISDMLVAPVLLLALMEITGSAPANLETNLIYAVVLASGLFFDRLSRLNPDGSSPSVV